MSIDKDFEDFFRDRLEGLEETPPANGWEKIRADIKPWYKKVNWLAAAALLLLLPALVYFGMQVAGPAKNETALRSGEAVGPEASKIAANSPQVSRQEQLAGSESGTDPNEVLPEAASGGQPEKSNQEIGKNTFSAAKPTVSKIATQPAAKNVSPLVIALEPDTEEASEDQAGTQHSAFSRRSKKAALGAAIAASVIRDQKPGGSAGSLNTRVTKPASENLSNTATTTRTTGAETSTSTTSETVATATAKPVLGFQQNAEIALLALRGLEQNELLLPNPLALLPLPESSKPNVSDASPLWSLSAYVSPRSTFSKYSANRNDGKLIRDMSKTNNSLSDVLSYETGLTIHRAVSERFSVDAGVIYTALKDEVHYMITTGEVKSVDLKNVNAHSAEVSINYNFYNESLKTRYSYTGLKLGTTYSLAQKEKTRFYLSGGGTLQFLVSSRTEVYRNDHLVSTSLTNLSDNPMQKMNGQLYGNFGFSRNFDHNWHIFAEPGFGYFLGSAFRKNEVLQLKPVTFGFNFGFRHTL